MKRGDDFFHEDFGGSENFDAEDIPCIAELDGDAWSDFDRSGDLALVADQVGHADLGVISELGFCNHALHFACTVWGWQRIDSCLLGVVQLFQDQPGALLQNRQLPLGNFPNRREINAHIIMN
jgi:hypothetical protein